MEIKREFEKIKRKLRSIKVGTFGAIATSLFLLSLLCDFGGSLIGLTGVSSPDLTNLLMLIVNVLFYFILTKDFLASRETNTLGRARYGILVLVIFNYILPAINLVISGLFGGSIAGVILILSMTTLFSGLAFGIGYFIMLIIEFRSRKHEKVTYTLMTIFGALLLLSSFSYVALDIFTIVSNWNMIINAAFDFAALLFLLSLLLDAFGQLFLGITFVLYPIYKYREIKRGY